MTNDNTTMVQSTACGGFNVMTGIDVFNCCQIKGGFKGLTMMVQSIGVMEVDDNSTMVRSTALVLVLV